MEQDESPKTSCTSLSDLVLGVKGFVCDHVDDEYVVEIFLVYDDNSFEHGVSHSKKVVLQYPQPDGILAKFFYPCKHGKDEMVPINLQVTKKTIWPSKKNWCKSEEYSSDEEEEISHDEDNVKLV